mgnify:CR=1 FL=1
MTGSKAAWKILWRGAGLVTLNVVLAFVIMRVNDARHDYASWKTDSVLLAMPHDREFHVLVMGASHAQFLSRYKAHHEVLESEWGGPVANIALPTGGGLVPNYLMMQTFYERGNRADVLLYVLDPFVFFADQVNGSHPFVYNEPFQFGFFIKALRAGVPPKRLFIYIQSKFCYDWFFKKPEPLPWRKDFLTEANLDDVARMDRRRATLYPEGMDSSRFEKYAETFRSIVDLAQAHGTRIICVIPPSLLGPEQGADKVCGSLDALQARSKLRYYDWSNELTDPRYFFDYDHLNLDGVRQFAELLRPVLARVDKGD